MVQRRTKVHSEVVQKLHAEVVKTIKVCELSPHQEASIRITFPLSSIILHYLNRFTEDESINSTNPQ